MPSGSVRSRTHHYNTCEQGEAVCCMPGCEVHGQKVRVWWRWLIIGGWRVGSFVPEDKGGRVRYSGGAGVSTDRHLAPRPQSSLPVSHNHSPSTLATPKPAWPAARAAWPTAKGACALHTSHDLFTNSILWQLANHSFPSSSCLAPRGVSVTAISLPATSSLSLASPCSLLCDNFNCLPRLSLST